MDLRDKRGIARRRAEPQALVMVAQSRSVRRILAPLAILSAVLLLGAASPVATSTDPTPGQRVPLRITTTAGGTTAGGAAEVPFGWASTDPGAGPTSVALGGMSSGASWNAAAAAQLTAVRAAIAARKAKAEAVAEAVAAAAYRAAHAVKNHFWIPALGISRTVSSFPCTRRTPPANIVYRWGCAGRYNVYILGHAYGVMRPLYEAYVSGRLRVGMVAIYADAKGNITRYRVTEWRVNLPTQVRWAIGSQRVPSMTLQTCVGSHSQYRLNVRLVAFG